MNLLQNFLLLALVIGGVFVGGPTQAAQKNNLFDMVDQLDAADKLDFKIVIDRANVCTRERNFSCSESELSKAAKVANSSQDKKVLALARQNIVNEKARVAEEARQQQARLEEEREERRERQRERQAERDREDEEDRQQPNVDILAGLRQNIDSSNRMSEITNNRVAEINRRAAEEVQARAHLQQEAREQAAQRRRDDERDRNSRLASADAQRERDQRAERERARESEQRRQREEQSAAERRAREQEQARVQEERRQREAKAAADKRAEEKRKADFLASLKQGIRLRATKCMGGEGKYYVTGSKPAGIKNEVSCVDVFFQARCPGAAVSSRGVLGNFVGMSGCLGDLKEVDPKPGCPVEQVQVEVTDVQATCNHGW
jgi:hypothetical protein